MKPLWKYRAYKTLTFELEKSQTETLDAFKRQLKWAVTMQDDKIVISSSQGRFSPSSC